MFLILFDWWENGGKKYTNMMKLKLWTYTLTQLKNSKLVFCWAHFFIFFVCLQALKVNLIITDYTMPGMTGYELLKKIKVSPPVFLLENLWWLQSYVEISKFFPFSVCWFDVKWIFWAGIICFQRGSCGDHVFWGCLNSDW